MKTFLSILFCLAMTGQAMAGKEKSAAKKESTGVMKVYFSNHVSAASHSDSVLVIFDKYDRTGAGIIRKICYVDADHAINVSGVPEGKYYVTIRCLGLQRDYIEKIVRVSNQKTSTVKIKLEAAEEFSKDKVVIPDSQNDFKKYSFIK